MKQAVYRFGYGSNMSVKNMEKKKGLSILWSGPGVLKNFRLGFFQAITYYEPGFATIEASVGDEVHGLVFAISPEQAKELDAQEVRVFTFSFFFLFFLFASLGGV
jgi:hypothetical protein